MNNTIDAPRKVNKISLATGRMGSQPEPDKIRGEIKVRFEQEIRPRSNKLTNDEIHQNIKRSRQLEDSVPEFEIDKTQFKVMSSQMIKQISVCEITSHSLTDIGGINDPRLGPLDESSICETCFKTLRNCPGHYGYIDLACPIINPEMKNVVLSLLSCVCNDCSSLLVSKAIINSDRAIISKRGSERLAALAAVASKCGQCSRPRGENDPICNHTPEYKVTENKDIHVVKYQYKCKVGGTVVQSSNIRTVEEVFTILDHIADEDLPYLGFGGKDAPHPRDMIMRNMIVPPPSCRPPLIQDGEKKQDFITTSFIHIITTNEKLKKDNMIENKRKETEKKLALLIFSLISATNEVQQGKSGSSKSIRKKFYGKDGLTRKGANGKRGDFAGRTVLGGDSTLPFGWISIPREFARVLTRKVVVTTYNVERMKRLYASGRVTHNTSSMGRYAGNSMLISPLVKEYLVPKLGDVLDVLMEDGDIVTFNRQPTLHKSCMMAFRVRLHEANTIRIHSSITKATNADFDGDDANIYMHQGSNTIIENYLLANVEYNIANSHRGGVMTSLYYHAVLGAYLLTKPGVFLDKEDWDIGIDLFRRSVTKFNQPDERKLAGWSWGSDKLPLRFESLEKRLALTGVPMYSGVALFSALLPPDFCMDYGGLKIRHGVLVQGQVTGKAIDGFGLVHQMVKNYGVDMARQFITEAQWLFDWYLSIRTCSLSLADIVPSNRAELREYVEETLGKTQLVVNQFYKDEMDDNIREGKILAALGQMDDGGQKVAMKFMDPENNYVAIYSSGARGSANNFKCMMAMYGQEVNCGMRPKFTISNYTRFCCFNSFNDHDVTAKGFITRSLVEGLDPVSYIMHMDGSRDGISASNLTTPESGFMNRKLNNVLRDNFIGTTGEVITVNKHIMQFSYGDGMDPAKTTLTSSLERGTEKYFIDIKGLIRRLIIEACPLDR